MNSKAGHIKYVNFKRDRFPTQFTSGFISFRLKIITDTDHEVKPCIITDLLAKTIVMLKIILIFKCLHPVIFKC